MELALIVAKTVHQLRIVARLSAESVICCGHCSSPGPAAAQPSKSRLFLEVP
jgi:hypothetical protein